MCGRFVRKRNPDEIADEFGVEDVYCSLPPSYNIAPTQQVAVVVQNSSRRLIEARWGLIPSGAIDPSVGNKMINARAETLLQRPSFREAFKKRRCLVAADGFYEWLKQGRARIPYYFHFEPDRPFGFAGLYEVWNPPSGQPITTCTIITTEPNELMKSIHDRMPAIIPREGYELWLDSSFAVQPALLDLLKPCASEQMTAYTVSQIVNSPNTDSPDCIKPASANTQLRLL